MFKILLLIVVSLACSVKLTAKCPEKGWLKQQILSLRDSVGLSPNKQLKELLRFERSLSKCETVDSVHVLLLERIARLFEDQGDYITSIEFKQKAIVILRENLNKGLARPVQLTRSYVQLAYVFDSLDRVKSTMEAFDSCIAVARRWNVVDEYCLYALMRRVNYLSAAGDYELCVKYAVMGETLSTQIFPHGSSGKSLNQIEYSTSFLIPRADALIILKRCNEAEKLLLEKIAECKGAKALQFLGSLFELLAKAQMENKNYGKVILNMHEALNYNTKAKLAFSCKINLDNLGYYTYQITKDNKKALALYKKALEYKELTSEDALTSLNIYNHIANVFVRTGQFDSARYYFQCAFDQIEKGTNETRFLQSPLDTILQTEEVRYLTDLFIDKGYAYFREYELTKDRQALKEAIRIYKSTDLLLDLIKTSQLEIQSKLFWRNDAHQLYEQGIRASIEDNNPEDAFYFFEKSRAILLNDQLNEQHWLNENDIAKQHQLMRKLGEMDKQLKNTDRSSKRYVEIERQWYNLKQQEIQLQHRIKKSNPLYYQSFLDTTFTTLRDVQKTILKDHQGLVELFVGDSAVYSMVITPTDIFFTKCNRKDYEITLNHCITYTSDPDLQNRGFNSFAQSSKHLYDLIFQNHPVPAGRIIISPDGRYFPFEALITSFSGRRPVYFLEDHAVSYTYSARYLMNKFVNASRPTTKNFLGIAPVQFPEQLELSPLVGSNLSVETLEGFFSKTDHMLEERATKKNFQDNFGRYKIIQIYTHSSETSSEGEPVIYFADTPLYLSEITSQKQPATELVVLSACETGKGKFYQGEGVFSFNRAFAAIGIPSCVNNLWSVDNESTYELTELFFRHLSTGLTIDRALQQAKLEFIRTTPERGPLPFYWAAAILAGKTNPVHLKDPLPWFWIVAIIVTGAIATWVVASKFTRGKYHDKPFAEDRSTGMQPGMSL